MSIVIATYTAPGTPYRATIRYNPGQAGYDLFITDTARNITILSGHYMTVKAAAARMRRGTSYTWKRDT